MSHPAREVILVSSVNSPALDLVTTALRSSTDYTVRQVTAFNADEWRTVRGSRSSTSMRARLRGLAFPLRARRTISDGSIVIATTNPFWLPILMTVRPRWKVISLIYDVYPDALTVRWRLPRAVVAALNVVLGSALRRSDAIVVLGRRIGESLSARHRLNRSRLCVIPVGANGGAFEDVDLNSSSHDRVLISYVGNSGSMHEGRTLALALQDVLRANEKVDAVIATRGDRAEELVAPLRGAPRVQVTSNLSIEEFGTTLTRTDIALVSLDFGAERVSFPSKIFPALAAGCAVLAITPKQSDLADLVLESGAGLVVEPGDVDGARDALERLIVDVPRRHRHASAARRAADQFGPEQIAMMWANVLGLALAPDSGRSQ